MSEPTAPKLSTAQQTMLDNVTRDGVRKYNGRARRTVEALRAAGLVEVEVDSVPQTKGGGIQLVTLFTVRPVR